MTVLLIVLGVIAAFALAFQLYFQFASRIGANPSGERLARIQRSPSYRDGKLHNVVPTDMDLPFAALLKLTWEMIKGGQEREPKDVIPNVPFDRAAWERTPDEGVTLAWFGHSSLLVKLDGTTFLLDPVFGERASTFSFAGPKRFPYREHMRIDLLPQVDVVLLSHDHYDHLDAETIGKLVRARPELEYLAPIGVGAHLERWGVPSARITELDRWEGTRKGSVDLVLTPTRHFSGRRLSNRFGTQWGAWILRGTRNIYFGADSGYSPTFKEVGERYGPFDLALLECGAYNLQWHDIHMLPEETAQAAKDVRARVLMPIHWGKFSLALHPWKEPVQRLSAAAERLGVPLFTPRPGSIVHAPTPANSERWWEDLH